MEWTFEREKIAEAAGLVLRAAVGHKVIAFYGDMGAGKTTLIGEICRQIGSADVVSSPTFALINQYVTDRGGQIFHIDLYRLSGAEEALAAGVGDCLDSGHLCLVEWPERAESLLPEDTLTVRLTTVSADVRKLQINS
jgi:tRNA threonylcarbamoyladenosine biosynthesis protein TsaE